MQQGLGAGLFTRLLLWVNFGAAMSKKRGANYAIKPEAEYVKTDYQTR